MREAKKLYDQGLKFEQAEDWVSALEVYREALELLPHNPELLLRRDTVRFQIVQQHTDRAEREALAGHLDRARAELQEALRLDPGYSVARERLAQFEQAARGAPEASPGLAGLAELQPQPGSRDFNVRGDTRSAYQAIASQFGLVVSFDEDLPARQVRLRVNGVDFTTAMKIASRQTRTFWRALDSRTFFVADDTPQKRREYAPVVARTIILPASTTPDRMTEIQRLVREIAGVTHAVLDTRTRTLTLRDTPENVTLAAALITQVEQAPAELMLEIEILEVNRNEARRLGITPPSSARLISVSTGDIRAAQQAQNFAALLAIIQRIFGTSIPPVVAFGGGSTIFLATLPGAAADFSEALSLVRSGRRVLLRAQDGQPATFFVGDRFPIALAVLGSSLVPPASIISMGQTTFPRTDHLSGGSPIALVAGRFTASGHVDLAVANQSVAGQSQTANSISVFPGNPDGTFGTRVDTPLSFTPLAIATADFDGDGKQDLAVVSRSPDAISILLGNGDGTFKMGSTLTLTPGSGPIAIAAADFNGDGHADLVVVNQTAGTVTVFLNSAANPGTFTAGQTLTTGAGPVALVAADFNGDGHTDLAVVNQTAGTVTVFLNRAANPGTFTAGQTLTTGVGPVALIAADLNGDGHTDLAVASQDVVNQTAGTVAVFLNNAANPGTFTAGQTASTGNRPVALAAADFNVDGKLDLAVANQGSSTITLLLGNGDGTFGTRLEVATGTGPSGILTADFNGDSRADLAVSDQNANAISVILNPTVAIAPTNIPQTAFPGAEYEDLGLKVRATPRVHGSDEVTLQLEFEIRALAGTSINQIPVISNRTVSQTVRLRQNETSVLSGIVQQEETRAITGLPGFARAPGVGYLAGRRELNKSETELLIFITPRQLRLAPHTDRSIYAGHGATGSGPQQ